MLIEFLLRLFRRWKRQRTLRLRIEFRAESQILMSPASIQVGQSIVASAIPFEADGVTQTPGAVVSSQSWSVSPSTSVVEQTINADGTATYTGAGPGTAVVYFSGTVTDTNGAVSTLSSSATITVAAPAPPVPLTASVNIGFSAPVAEAATAAESAPAAPSAS
jgi:hypothetical protein